MTPRHAEIESRFRSIVEGAGLLVYDAVVHEERAVVFLWHEPRVCIVVDLEEDDPLPLCDLERILPPVEPLSAFEEDLLRYGPAVETG